jgi:hypothetical protein
MVLHYELSLSPWPQFTVNGKYSEAYQYYLDMSVEQSAPSSLSGVQWHLNTFS